MSERQRGEKEEKREEKEEKGRRPGDSQVGGRRGTNWEEKWRRDPLSLVLWAAVLIWAGLVLLADNLGLLAGIGAAVAVGDRVVTRFGAWDFILTGIGVIILLGAAVRLVVPEYRRPVRGMIVLGVILLAIGLGSLISWGLLWPALLIAVGLVIILSRLLPPR